MILTVLGGSAHSTPILVQCLEGAFVEERVIVRLVGRNMSRVRAVGRACRMIADRGHVAVEEYAWPEWTQAVRDSDAVLIQIRPGGYESRAFDETFPLQCAVPGDEGLGPGGLAAAWRCWPVVREIVDGIRTHSRDAAIVLLTSPLSLLVRLAGAGVIGVCELPWTTLCAICGDSELARQASFDYHGLNHVGWIYNLRIDGRQLPEVSGTSFPADVVRCFRAWPLKYLQLHYRTNEVVAEQRRTPGARACRLIDIARRSFDAFAFGNRSEIEHALSARSADWYPDAVVPLLRAIRGWPVQIPLFLTRGDDPETEERCYRALDGRLEARKPSLRPPCHVAQVVAQFARFERIAAEAVERGCEELLIEALSLHPWVRSRDHAACLARNVVAQTTGDGACVGFASQ